jgi:hypothetical protein
MNWLHLHVLPIQIGPVVGGRRTSQTEVMESTQSSFVLGVPPCLPNAFFICVVKIAPECPALHLFWFSGSDPTFKDINSFLWPCAVARHRSVAKALQNCRSVFVHIGVRPKVEGELHRLPIALPKQRFDVPRERHDIVGTGKDDGMVFFLRFCGSMAETRLPGGPAVVIQSQCGIGICSGGLAFVCEFSTARREPHPMYAWNADANSASFGRPASFADCSSKETHLARISSVMHLPRCCDSMRGYPSFAEVAGQQNTPMIRMLMMEPAPVARIGIDSMLQHRSSVIAGLLNKMIVFGSRFTPRRLQRQIMQSAVGG